MIWVFIGMSIGLYFGVRFASKYHDNYSKSFYETPIEGRAKRAEQVKTDMIFKYKTLPKAFIMLSLILYAAYYAWKHPLEHKKYIPCKQGEVCIK